MATQKQTTLNRYQALFLVLLAAVGFIIYSNTLGTPFIFDDVTAIKDNPSIRMTEFSGRQILHAAVGYAENRPVSMLSFALNYYFGKYNPAGYHLVNIFIHIANAILLFFFLNTTLTISNPQRVANFKLDPLTVRSLSFCAALLWLAHPVQTQSVTYIVQRMNSMAAMFFILALLLYAKGRLSQRGASQSSEIQDLNERQPKNSSYHYVWFLGCGLAGVLAFGSKESTASLPFIIFLYEWYFFQDLNIDWLKRSLKYVAVMGILCGLVAFIYLGAEPWEKIKNLRDFSDSQFTMGQRLLTQTRVVIHYLSLLVYPQPSRLNFDYDFALSYSLINPFTTLLALAAIIGLLILGIYLAPRERLISFCIFWFFGNLVIESSVVPLALIFEHRLYLPSMLPFLIPVSLCYRYIKLNWLRAALLCLAVVVLGVWTYQRNRVWQTDLSLWTDNVKKSPNKARPHLNLGKSLSELGKTDAAIKHYTEALRIKPDYGKAHHNLGNVMISEGKPDKAIKHFSEALKIDPGFAEAHGKLGFVLAQQGRTDEAIRHYLKALKLKPDDASAHLNLGVALSAQGRTDQAISRFYRALEINPDLADAHYNLAIALEMQGNTAEAINHYLSALKIDPDHAETHYNLGNILAKQGRTDEAIVHYEKALRIQPDFARAFSNVALLYAAGKQYDKALKAFKRVVALQPDNSSSYYNIAALYALRNNVSESIKWLKLATEKGYQNWDLIKTDKDLENIRNSADYRELVKGH